MPSASTQSAAPTCSSSKPSRSANPAPARHASATATLPSNFIDIYFRSGQYPVPALPSGVGSDAVGVVEAVGPGVSDIQRRRPGRLPARPAWARMPDVRLMPAEVLIPAARGRVGPHGFHPRS